MGGAKFLICLLDSSHRLFYHVKLQIRASLDKVFRLHNGYGVHISQIRCDNEFKSLFDEIKDNLDVEMD